MIHNMWTAWGWMTAAVVVNGVCAWLWPIALWVTMPLALLLVLHYWRVMGREYPHA
jgi:CBS-domain-containing membrane protein